MPCPRASGSQSAFEDRQTIALAGDGGLSMLLGELITLTQNKLPVKTVVYNNSSLNFVELEMKAAGFVTFGTELSQPRFLHHRRGGRDQGVPCREVQGPAEGGA
jgi:thiamine pyrophosphate-dependent acetolactate synthase large subunit-like protein